MLVLGTQMFTVLAKIPKKVYKKKFPIWTIGIGVCIFNSYTYLNLHDLG
jgi:hypothetical protein